MFLPLKPHAFSCHGYAAAASPGLASFCCVRVSVAPLASETLEQTWQPCNDRTELQGTMLPVTLGALALPESIAWSLLLLPQRLFCPEKDLTLHKRELGVTSILC